MSALLGRALLTATAILGVALALQPQSSAELPRVISIVIAESRPAAEATLVGSAGSIDKIADTAAGLLIEGWAGAAVDSIYVISTSAVESQQQNVVLFKRPDVEAAGLGLLTGFSTVLSGIEKGSVRCIVFLGSTGSAEVWKGTGACR